MHVYCIHDHNYIGGGDPNQLKAGMGSFPTHAGGRGAGTCLNAICWAQLICDARRPFWLNLAALPAYQQLCTMRDAILCVARVCRAGAWVGLGWRWGWGCQSVLLAPTPCGQTWAEWSRARYMYMFKGGWIYLLFFLRHVLVMWSYST